jgi:hypothetical protein
LPAGPGQGGSFWDQDGGNHIGLYALEREAEAADDGGDGGRMKGAAAVIVALLAILAAAGGVAWWGWNELADVEMGRHGWIALGLGAGVTLGLGVGLMWLVFYSHHHGYDDRVGRD